MPPPQDVQTEVLVREGGQLKLRTRLIHIDIVEGPNAGQTTRLAGPEVRIGSGRGCQLVLLDRAVSRHHATLRIDKGSIRVIDENSSNGTTVDGVRVRDAYARADSIIALGNSKIRLALDSGAVDLPLSSREHFGGLIGTSASMRQLYTLLELVVDTGDTVLVEGETGTGKELVAEALHEESARAHGPFVVFDCSAVSANLVESELFGHERGAFTGAVSDRMGAFEAEDEGTLFLDEIGELPLELQPKLLRALERREVRRLGSQTPRHANVRVVAATHRNLDNEVAQGRFREDLFYRLAVVRVRVPPLRERAGDIPLLVEHFARQHAAGRDAAIDERTLRELSGGAWPGNVRELRNAVARTLSLGKLAALAPMSGRRGGAPPPAVDLSVPLKVAKSAAAEALERAYCVAALEATGGNATKAAELAGVNRKYMQRAIKRYDLRNAATPRQD